MFALTPNAAKTEWTETVLYSFCSGGGAGAAPTARYPVAGLSLDAAGHFYGTTNRGRCMTTRSAVRTGTVFELTPNTAKEGWTETVLYSFCSQGDRTAPTANTPPPP